MSLFQINYLCVFQNKDFIQVEIILTCIEMINHSKFVSIRVLHSDIIKINLEVCQFSYQKRPHKTIAFKRKPSKNGRQCNKFSFATVIEHFDHYKDISVFSIYSYVLQNVYQKFNTFQDRGLDGILADSKYIVYFYYYWLKKNDLRLTKYC